MTRAKELLDAATPLPWHQGTDDIDDATDFPIVSTTWATAEDAALIVYAVNRLPDYEAAVEALERIAYGDEFSTLNAYEDRSGMRRAAIAALARLRDEVTA